MGYQFSKPLQAIAVLRMNGVQGSIAFSQRPLEPLHVRVRLEGVPPGAHGLHVHECGDVSGEACAAAGAHFNPHGHVHGGSTGHPRHPGDFGNVTAGADGAVRVDLEVAGLRLADLLGRSIVLHAGVDDLGRASGAKRPESLKTGNSGARLACGVIGRMGCD